MTKCTICNKNTAVVFTTRFENGKRFNEGLCLKCAYKTGLGAMDDIFTKAGINEDNIDEITEKINNVMESTNMQSPEGLLKMIVDGNMDGDSDFSESFESTDSDESEKREQNGLLPVAMAFPNEESSQSDNELSNRNHTDRDSFNGGSNGNEGERKEKKRKFLDQFGINLNDKAMEGRIDRIIGRDKELERVVQILNRRSKNNPVLLGAPGVGKTAIAEGLAVRIIEGNVPAKLLNLEVYLLDMTAMVAGTQFRGQFESRMKGVVDDAKRAGNIVLVIDELHNIMGAGDAEGAMNAANILKPALAKGEIKVLGSTTMEEYRRFIEKDSALERRFQQVIVKEPSKQESIEILKGIKDYYEQHHHVVFDDQAIEAAVVLSDRYIMDRLLPDKAIDLLDEAGSKANLNDEHEVKMMESRKKITEY